MSTLRIVLALATGALLLAAPIAPAQTPLSDDFNPGANDSVYCLAVQADGKILVGGYFTTLGGQTRNYLGRLNPDGTLDTGFNPGANSYVFSLAVQADGKILVGGVFSTLGGQTRNGIGRLNPDGTLDTGFNPGANGGSVDSLAVQADGKILVGGQFTTLGGQTRNRIGRLNPNGTLDTAFNPGASSPNPGANSSVTSLAVQADGKILVGGAFTTLGGQTRRYLGRLNLDGTLDTAFDPGPDSYVSSLAVQADGKILVGGDFSWLGVQMRNRIGRLNADGTPDTAFNPGANDWVRSLAVQADGKILVGGYFTTLGGQTRNYLGRLNPVGTLDTAFNAGADNYMHSLAVQADGKILAGGQFTTLGGQTRNCLGRLNATDAATSSLSFEGSTITWLRGGTSPEVWRTAFDWSSDSLLWTPLGDGTRVPGGWQLTNAVVPVEATIRARGFVTGGRYNGSGWFVENYTGLGWIAQPQSRTNDAGTTAAFGAVARGMPPLRYQWFKDGAVLADGSHIAGATTTSLILTNVLGADAGGYSLVVSNASGARTSVVATLTVKDPVITVPPLGQNRELGENATLSVTALGTPPLGYQWWKDGVALMGRTDASLTLTNPLATDAGSYWVAVTSPYGSVTSQVALLTVNQATADLGFSPEADGDVSSLAVQADGKILVGGLFTTLGGQTRSRIGRLNPDGTLDPGFNPGADDGLTSLAVQTDGKILVGGWFTTLGGQTRNYLGRLNPEGTLDTAFNPGAGGDTYPYVCSLAVQADGKILVGGLFTTLGGQTRNCLGRLNPDGTLDTTFNPEANDEVYSLAVQADGKILVGGWFTTLGGQTRNYLGRLNPDGSLDTAFNPGANDAVCSLAVQADGKILVGGAFSTLGGQTRNCLGRLNPDGTLDAGFDPGANDGVGCLAVQADGKILVVGYFSMLGGQMRSRIGRLNSDGTLDTGFNPGADSGVYSLAVQADGKILVGGQFAMLAGQTRNYLGRLNATDPATQSLSFDGSTITWLRGGTSPEVWRTTFDYSLNGVDWISLGEGSRIPGGWQQTSVGLPLDTTIRALGYTVGGDHNGSGGLVESLIGVQPVPDLQVALWDTPSDAVAGASVSVAWTIVNLGGKPAAGPWVDRVYLSPDPVVGDDRWVGDFSFTGTLETNQALPRSYSVVVPADLEPDRDYWWIVVTDASNTVVEENELNNVRVSGASMRLRRPPVLTIGGTVSYYPTNYPSIDPPSIFAEGVTVSLTGWTNLNAITAGDGSYSLTNLSTGGDYCVTPGKTDDSPAARGVTSLDLALIQRHILGKASLDSPYKLLAADVNGSSNVTSLDLALIQRLILGKTNQFPAGLWRFVPSDCAFTNSQSPWGAPANRSCTNVVADLMGQNFVAIKLGDVNNSWTPPVGGQALSAGNDKTGRTTVANGGPAVRFQVSSQSAEPGEKVTARVTASGFARVTSAQFSLAWDPAVLRFLGTSGYGFVGESANNFGASLSDSGTLTFTWHDPAAAGVTLADGTVVFTVSFTVIGQIGSVSPLALVDWPTAREVGVDFAVANFGTQNGQVSVVERGTPRLSQATYGQGVFRLSVPTEHGRRYILEFTDALPATHWTSLPAVEGDGNGKILTDPLAPSHQRFYRVRVE